MSLPFTDREHSLASSGLGSAQLQRPFPSRLLNAKAAVTRIQQRQAGIPVLLLHDRPGEILFCKKWGKGLK